MAVTVFRRLGRSISAVQSVRGILDYPSQSPVTSAVSDILLHRSDLLPSEDDYLKVVDKEYFRKKYGDAKRIFVYAPIPTIDPMTKQRIPRRFAAVVGLDVRNLGVIPIPVILNSGAPGSLYLGSKPLKILMDINIIQEMISGEHPYVIKNAVISHGEWKIDPVFVCPVPRPHENQDTGTFGNICCNILGAQALWHLPDLLQLKENLHE